MSTAPQVPAAKFKILRFPKRVVLLLLLAAVIALAVYFAPGWFRTPLNTTDRWQIYYMGDPAEQAGYFQEEELYLPFDFVKEKLDPDIRWDEKNKVVIITTGKHVFHFPLGSKEGLLNLEPYSFTYPVVQKEGAVYLPADPLQDFYRLEIVQDKENMVARIHSLEQPVQQGKITARGKLRQKPSVRSPWTAEVAADEEVIILREKSGWYWVETAGGKMGYLDEKKVELAGIKTAQVSEPVYPPWNPLKRPVIVTWEYAGLKTASPGEIGALDGVQAVSPTWFHLQNDGLVVNRADKKYVRWAHDTGRQVWGLFDNGFDPEVTHAFLNDVSLRTRAIKQLLSYVDLYELDGINLDFENIYLQDREAYVQFVRELAPLLHEKERMLTVDVTFHSPSENWSRCYDRSGLAQAADYLLVMGYDEHGAGSPTAGPVASLPWVERGLERMLEEVPADKLILGVPFYTRLWTEETDESGTKKLTSRTLSMEQAEEWIAENKVEIKTDGSAGQHYVELKKGNTFHCMWLEDDFSLAKRIELMKKYRLAGLAAWRRGFEKQEIWPLLGELVRKAW
ncbi:MAG: glycosyl hydrolase family 18 protein [Peptococcaceae bacterium]|jgi:hypothetical protein|nr:glycosyl hydrolase family 18 protein [Peptococcaceae bacterium]MDH7524258.1 glycosyl hydrolase family 18 protein [Peptococcaceae bacterium]